MDLRRAFACLLVALALATGCRSSTDSAARAPTVPPTEPTTAAAPTTTSTVPASTVPATTAPSTTVPGTQRCSSSSLALSAGDGRAALGHALYLFGLRNTSSQPCRLDGYPAVALLDPRGAELVRAKPGSGYILPDRPPSPVPLAPGGTAWFGLEASTLCEGDAIPTASPRLTVTPPGGTGTLSAEVTIDVCPGDTVLVSPVRARDTEVTR